MKILKMTDFVLNLNNNDLNENKIESIFNYAQFLKQPLAFWMFVPCDEEGNVLEEPKGWNWFSIDPCRCEKCAKNNNIQELDSYKQAKERVLFEGFEVKKSNLTENLQGDFLIISETNQIIAYKNNSKWIFNPYTTVEDLIPYNLTLNEYKKPPVY